MFRSISLVVTPPIVSIPSESGVTSSNSTSLTSPCSTPPWIAAPIATTSSGFTPFNGSFPKIVLTFSTTAGIRVIPPTSTISSISLAFTSASLSAFSTGSTKRSIRSFTSSSSLDLVSLYSKCFGPSASAVMNGRLISYSLVDESSFFAFSASSFKRCMAALSLLRSTPSSFLNTSRKWFTMRLSKSSPPRCVSPLVERTSNTPSPSSRIETSKVPPPRSKTAIFSSFFESSPYANAAAVGSLIIRFTSRPAILPASLVAWRCESSKYAGTVITASVTLSPRKLSASALIFERIMADTSSGL